MRFVKPAVLLALVCFCLTITVSSADAVTKNWALRNLVNKVRGYVLPVWQIFEPGTVKEVQWEVHAANPRFAVFDPGSPGTSDDLVLDRETGLVWEREPSAGIRNWQALKDWCWTINRGGRKGFRTPTMAELGSIMDLGNSNPVLPDNHPFQNVVSSYYWSANSQSSTPTAAWVMHFGDGDPGIWAKTNIVNVSGWCVRGGQDMD